MSIMAYPYPYERCKGCPQCASPPETFISKSSGKVIRKVQHGLPKLVSPPADPANPFVNTAEMDPRILMLQLKDMERKRAAEERKKAQEEAAAERKRQKTKTAINQMSRELGIGIEFN